MPTMAGSEAVRAYLLANPDIDKAITEQIKVKMYEKTED